MSGKFLLTLVTGLFLTLTTSHCGPSKKSKSDENSSSAVMGAFSDASGKYGIPVRLMLAAAFLESNMNPARASAPYYQIEGTDSGRQNLGFGITETAFGIPRNELGLNGSETPDNLETQIDAYGQWIRSQLDAKGVELQPDPSTVEDMFYWIWELAQLHRSGEQLRRNIRVVWAQELIAVLNEGRLWQDPENGETLELTQEPELIAVEDFPSDGRKLFRLQTNKADILNAQRFEMTNETSSTLENNATHIRVIHCPLGLSACLELQDQEESTVKLDAHYIIPQNDEVVTRSLQVKDHRTPVQITDSSGLPADVTDAIVIMLVGNSGRYVKGIRVDADPTWFTPWQLKQLDFVVNGVCNKLSQEYPGVVNAQICSAAEGKQGVQFQNQELRATHRWGDIADYEKSIFAAYLRSSDSNITGEATMEFPNKSRTFNAGDIVETFARFQPGAMYVELQRAVRCPDQQLVWQIMRGNEVKNQTVYPFNDISVFDGGPNANGRHFFRIVVYGENHELYGWAISDFFIRNFDPKRTVPSGQCLNREPL